MLGAPAEGGQSGLPPSAGAPTMVSGRFLQETKDFSTRRGWPGWPWKHPCHSGHPLRVLPMAFPYIFWWFLKYTTNRCTPPVYTLCVTLYVLGEEEAQRGYQGGPGDGSRQDFTIENSTFYIVQSLCSFKPTSYNPFGIFNQLRASEMRKRAGHGPCLLFRTCAQ